MKILRHSSHVLLQIPLKKHLKDGSCIQAWRGNSAHVSQIFHFLVRQRWSGSATPIPTHQTLRPFCPERNVFIFL